MKSKNNPSWPSLLAFVRSRLPMFEHDFGSERPAGGPDAKSIERIGKYCSTQAFFYQADYWVRKPPLVSVAALAHAKNKWGKQADCIWSLARNDITKLEGTKISKASLIFEHVVTGSMFHREMIKRLHMQDGKPLVAEDVARWLIDNFQTAWITREEDDKLSLAKFKSHRGNTLQDAMQAYAAVGIKLATPPVALVKMVASVRNGHSKRSSAVAETLRQSIRGKKNVRAVPDETFYSGIEKWLETHLDGWDESPHHAHGDGLRVFTPRGRYNGAIYGIRLESRELRFLCNNRTHWLDMATVSGFTIRPRPGRRVGVFIPDDHILAGLKGHCLTEFLKLIRDWEFRP